LAGCEDHTQRLTDHMNILQAQMNKYTELILICFG